MVQELGAFIAGLEVTLTQGVNDKRMAAVRVCIQQARIAKPDGVAEIEIRKIPTARARMKWIPTAP